MHPRSTTPQLTELQRQERNELCKSIILAQQLTGGIANQMAEAVLESLPPDHWLKTSRGRASFWQQLAHEARITYHQNKNFRKAHS